MRVRGIAAALSVFLAVVSSWASACDLSCSLQRIAAGCDDRAAAQASAGPHCGHAAQAKNSEALRAADEMPGMPDMPGMRASHGDAGTESISPVVHDGQPCSRSSLSASAAAETSRSEFKGTPFVAIMFVSIGRSGPRDGRCEPRRTSRLDLPSSVLSRSVCASKTPPHQERICAVTSVFSWPR